ncbi:hypothetical protein QN277_006081 [Acacia crassicarpa]|uniref:C3H1-type domain-containing protein n=1 Tax=Acacia crassicarpa TaxID=499986 RepID=A0AAE1IZA0_9FABA|nr:hypothetical protein QN277_006081 [Acacia crassicarpa]
MRSVRPEGNLISVSPAVGSLEVKSPSYLPLMEGNAAMAKVSVPSYNVPTVRKKDFQLKRKLSSSPESRKNLDLEDDKNQGLETDAENAGIAGSLLRWKTSGGYSEPSCNYTSYLFGVSKDISSGPFRSFTDFGKDGTIDLERECFVEKASGDQNHIKDIRRLIMQSGDAMSPTTSSFSRHPSNLRTRDLPPRDETKVGNKHHANICAFYAKGWCIKGNSCSFVHIKDPENKSGQQIEGELVTQNWKREVQQEEGIGDDVKRSREPYTQVPLAATQERTSLDSSEFSLNPIIQREVGPAWHPNKSWSISAFPSGLTHTEGITTTQAEGHSPNLNMATHLPTTCMSLSPHIPSQSGCPLSFSGSLGESSTDSQQLLSTESSIDSQQLLNSGMAYHDSRSTFSGSRREGLALSISFGVPPHPTGCKLKFSSYDWEPSIPFTPSFFITSSSRSSVEDQKDPFHGSVEISNLGDGSLKAFILPQRIQTSWVPTNGGSVEAASQGSDLHGAKSSVSSHNRCNKTESEKSCVPHEKGFVATETGRIAARYLNFHVGRVGMGLKTFEDVKDIGKEQTEVVARRQVEVTEFKKQRVDRDQENSEMDNNLQKDVDMQIESMELRNFRFALVDHVKEVLSPVWLEGHLSKDVHNMIVKKSVDKIISALQPHQIPPNEESIKKYLSFREVKIANLVKEYTSIYGEVR